MNNKDIERHCERNKSYQAQKYIYNDMLSAIPTSSIVDRLMNDEYDIGYKYSKSGAQGLINKVTKRMKEDYAEEMKEIASSILTKYYDLYHESYKADRYMDAKLVLDSIVKLTGASEPEKKEITLNNINISFKTKGIVEDES